MGHQALHAPQEEGAGEGVRLFEGPVYLCDEGFFSDSPDLPWVCHLQTAHRPDARKLVSSSMGAWLEKRLAQHGAVLLRGLPIRDSKDFDKALRYLSIPLHDDLAGNSRRKTVRGRIYESSRLEPHHVLDLHNEATYKSSPPRRLLFCCCIAALDGGETPIGDSHKVFRRIDPEIREEFLRKGIMYVRHLDQTTTKYLQSWQDSFGTSDRSVVESVCKEQGMDYEWYGEQGLKLSEVRDAAVIHPATQQWCWINQIHLSHRTRWIRTGLIADGLEASAYPTGTYYGDGTEIPDEVVGHIRRCWFKEEKIFFWQPGDILALDNLWVAHGRKPYYGTRKLLLAISA